MTTIPTPDAPLALHWAFVVQVREGTALTPEARPTPAESATVGGATGLPIGWHSSTGPTSGPCLNDVHLGLDRVSTAGETASADTRSSSCTFSLATDGGGPAATAALHNAFVAENAAGEAFYALSAQGHAEACTPLTSHMAQGATEAGPIFNQLVAALSGATNPDLSFLQPFPHGGAGAITSPAVTPPIPYPVAREARSVSAAAGGSPDAGASDRDAEPSRPSSARPLQ